MRPIHIPTLRNHFCVLQWDLWLDDTAVPKSPLKYSRPLVSSLCPFIRTWPWPKMDSLPATTWPSRRSMTVCDPFFPFYFEESHKLAVFIKRTRWRHSEKTLCVPQISIAVMLLAWRRARSAMTRSLHRPASMMADGLQDRLDLTLKTTHGRPMMTATKNTSRWGFLSFTLSFMSSAHPHKGETKEQVLVALLQTY